MKFRIMLFALSILFITGCTNNPYIAPKHPNNSKLLCYSSNDLNGMFHWDSFAVMMIDGKNVDFGFSGNTPTEITAGKHKLLLELKFHKDGSSCSPCTSLISVIVDIPKNGIYTIKGKVLEMDAKYQIWIEDIKTHKKITKIITKELNPQAQNDIYIPIMI